MSLRIAGIDEAGRGPLAGPVVVAAVVFTPGRTPVNGMDDSKALSERTRERLYPRILERALAWKIVFVEVDEIDHCNILQATLHGMREALLGVLHAADCARIDGNQLPADLPCPAEAWIGGDGRDRSIMAASILAKVARDARMRELHARYPHYGFDRHKGYASPVHLQALALHGPCEHHRRSFAPVRRAAESRDSAALVSSLARATGPAYAGGSTGSVPMPSMAQQHRLPSSRPGHPWPCARERSRRLEGVR